MPNALANKTGFNIIIVHFYIRLKLDIIQYATGFFFQYGSEPVLIQWILYIVIGFEAILEKILS